MNIIADKPSVTAEQARSILERHTEEMGVFIDLDRVCEYQVHFTKKVRPLKREFKQMAGMAEIEATQHAQVRSVLANRFEVNPALFQDKHTGAHKLDKEIVAKLMSDEGVSEDAKRFLTLYREIASGDRRISYLKQYVALPVCKSLAYDGNRMVIAKSRWSIASTSRILADTPSIQNIYRDLADLVTYPAGYMLYRSDSGQIEPRIIYSHFVKDDRIKYLINAYDDAYFGLLHYCIYNEHKDPVDVTPEMLDYRTELKTMCNAGNYGSQLDSGKFNPRLAREFINKVQQHPERLRWAEEVERAVDHGAKTFESAFGTIIVPPATSKYAPGSKQWRSHLVRCGINNPVQATAGDLMNYSVYMADRVIREKAKGFSRIGYYKHDEGAFYLHESDDALKDELIPLMGYQVRDWIPINYEPIIGRKKGYDISVDEEDYVDDNV